MSEQTSQGPSQEDCPTSTQLAEQVKLAACIVTQSAREDALKEAGWVASVENWIEAAAPNVQPVDQEAAEDGENNQGLMTPLRTRQAVGRAAARNIVQRTYSRPKLYATATNIVLRDLSTTITPASTASRILILANVTADMHWDGMFYLLRNSSEIGSPSSHGVGNRPRGSTAIPFDSNQHSTLATQTILYLDSPRTTRPVTYKIAVRYGAAVAFYLNRTLADTNHTQYERGTSRMICMEV